MQAHLVTMVGQAAPTSQCVRNAKDRVMLLPHTAGLGALVLRKKSAAILHKVYFGGGAVDDATAQVCSQQLQHNKLREGGGSSSAAKATIPRGLNTAFVAGKPSQ